VDKKKKAEANRRYRAKKALAAGREPGKNGRPKSYGPPKPRRFKGHGDRKAQYKRRRERVTIANADHGWVDSKHPIMDEAMAVANSLVKRDYRDKVAEDLWDDLVCEAALAIIEGDDPHEAAKAYKRYYNDFKYHCRTGEPEPYYDTLLEIQADKEFII
jgi:hypothetical protein